MAQKRNSLGVPYAKYYDREPRREDKELTHVGPGTPGGEYLRRFWQPVHLSAELQDAPVRLRVLGEDLVLFRDGAGRVGLLEPHCSHRGASLEFGRIAERGLRCCYHGWLYDIDGRILETPGEPRSTLKDRLFHPAYPVQEFGGLVFAYMGTPDRRPPLTRYDTFELERYRLVPHRGPVFPCNWIQIKENSMDPIHTVFLHAIVSGAQFTAEFGVPPEMEWHETPTGVISVATRRIGDNVWVRINDVMVPNVHQFPPTWHDWTRELAFDRPFLTYWAVPVDNATTMNLGFMHLSEDEKLGPDEIEYHAGFGQYGNRSYAERQLQPGDWDAQVSQGPIAVHAREHLTAADRGIIMFRKALRRGIQAVKKGEDPPGLPLKDDEVVPTYARNTVVRMPSAPTPEEERAVLRETARRVVESLGLPTVRR